ncbi:MAG TPA: HflC protein, partial [Deltaproteobacteria bacterium]|nr:HflC protein [Deltaproteobacteria bacterium]
MDPRDINSAKDAMRAAMRRGPKRSLVIIGAIIVGFLFLNPWVQVGAGERGVVLNFGAVQKDVLDEGLHIRIPVMQKVVRVDVKVQKAQTDAAAASSDLQDVSSTVAINYHIIPDKANIV